MKKKLLLFIASFFALSGNVTAASYTISVPNFTGYKGGDATMAIELTNDAICIRSPVRHDITRRSDICRL